MTEQPAFTALPTASGAGWYVRGPDGKGWAVALTQDEARTEADRLSRAYALGHAAGTGKKKKTKREVKREQVTAMVAEWAAERVTVTGDRADRVTPDEALADLTYWLAATGRPARPEESRAMAREAIVARVTEMGARRGDPGDLRGLRLEDSPAQGTSG